VGADVTVQCGGVGAGGGDSGAEVVPVHQGVSDDPGAGPDRHGVLAGLGGAHAAVGRQVGQALVVEFEQQPGGDVMSVGGQGIGAQPLVTVERQAGVVQAGQQPRQVLDQVGVVARLVLAASPVDRSGQGRQVGRHIYCARRSGGDVPGEDGRERLGIDERAA